MGDAEQAGRATQAANPALRYYAQKEARDTGPAAQDYYTQVNTARRLKSLRDNGLAPPDFAVDALIFANKYIKSGELGISMFYVIILAIYATAWAFALDLWLGEPTSGSETDDKVDIGWGAIAFIISFIFYRWLNRYIYGYSESPRKLKDILNDIDSFLQSFFAVVDTSTAAAVPLPKGSSLKDQLVEEIAYEMTSLAINSYQDISGLQSGVTIRNYLKSREKLTGRSVKAQNLFTKDYHQNMVRRESALAYQRQNSLFDVSDRRRYLFNVQKSVRRLLVNGFILPSDRTNSSKWILDLNTNLNKKETILEIREPDVFDRLMNLTLLTFFFLYLPFHFFVTMGFWMIVIYPIVVYLLSGYAILRMQLGDPFRDTDNTNAGRLRYGNWIPELVASTENFLYGYYELDKIQIKPLSTAAAKVLI